MKAYLMEKSARMGRALSERQAAQICAYHEILVEVNKSLNLTRVPDTMAEAADRNYLDSLAPWLMTNWLDKAERLLDVGAGAGFPGLPLAIALPDTRVVLLDSLRKRVDFINSVIKELGLNAEAVHFRAEEAAKRPELRERFCAVTARAVAALPTLCELTLPFARVGGAFIAYHGPKADEELPLAKEAIRILGGGAVEARKAPMPERDWDHRLLRIAKERPTPKAYPRKSGEPGRKPLGLK
ncbi:MAG: 16S rRNA (guanine(527)-N(7))-methyltransferase RsmG [Eubacteriales bacterium]|nr:16S rRNA (guanine(527)-N(7))-methyltransferase RsmG [Eubacteriales bacterium]